MRAVFTGRLPPDQLPSEQFKQLADLCVNCHQCRLECPANVDIPKLMLECKAQYVATNGLPSYDGVFARIERLSRWGCLMRPVANWAVRSRSARWVLEKLLGVAQNRKLPRFAGRNYLRRAQRRGLNRPTKNAGRKVLYFVDIYANWHDVELAKALVAVMEHNGVSVFVPSSQIPSGMHKITLGALDEARRVARRNVALLADAVRQGYEIIATEPSSALCLSHEYPNILDDPESRLVAQHSRDACAYLWQMHQSGELQLDMKPVNAVIGYHEPCHVKALGAGPAGENLLRLVPGLRVERIEQGCSGMAGVFGLKRSNFRTSLRAGWGLVSAMRDPRLQVGATECSACKIQMEQGGPKPTIHPIKILALAYGLMPELAGRLTEIGRQLMVT